MAKRKKYEDIYASTGKHDTFGMIYNGMLESKQYQKLPIGARYFYTLCRVQAKSKHGNACLYKHKEEYGTDYTENCFVFPASHMKRYGIERSNGSNYLKQLIVAGFIEKVENNKSLKKVNVYKFSNKWKNSS